MHDSSAPNWTLAALRGQPRAFPIALDPQVFAADVIGHAAQQGVIALLHHRIAPTSTWTLLPQEFRASLGKQSLMLAANELGILQELQEVFDRLAAQETPFLLFKGTPLAYSLYPEPALRQRCDTDILFADRDAAEHAWRILERFGYQRLDAVSGETISTQFMCHRRTDLGVAHAFDVHWGLNNSLTIANLFRFDELLARARTVPGLHEAARMPSLVDALVIACLHRMAHRVDGQHNRLIWLYDLHLLAGSLNEEEWRELTERCRRLAISQVVQDGLDAAHAHFGTALPADVMNELATDRSVPAVNPADYRTPWKRELGQLRALPTTRKRLGHVLSVLFPDPDYMLRKYGTEHAFWLPWLYARRIMEGMKKRLWDRRRAPGTGEG